MIEGVAQDALDDLCRFVGQQPALVLTLKLRLAKKDRDQRGAGRHHVFAANRAARFA